VETKGNKTKERANLRATTLMLERLKPVWVRKVTENRELLTTIMRTTKTGTQPIGRKVTL
jgi:hypothetical protein